MRSPFSPSQSDKFFRPRLVHFRSQYEQTPGLILPYWKNRKLSWRAKTVRLLLYKFRQARPSPLGMSKLPFELLDMIFRELCGNEIRAVRLVCTDWETASRPFFAQLHLQRSLFWLTRSDLRRLEKLARRFGPHVGSIHIATDQFTIAGLRQVWRNYQAHRAYMAGLTDAAHKDEPVARHRRASIDDDDEEMRTPFVGDVVRPLRDTGQLGAEYFKLAFQQRQPLSPWKFLRLWPLLCYFLCGILTQAWMRVTGQDRRRLTRIAEMMPQGRLEAVSVSYAGERLMVNERTYGRPSPGFASELALLCGKGDVLVDVEYGKHVERIVAEAAWSGLAG